jgi:hypothetical protein
MGLVDSPLCEECGESVDTPMHFLMSCPVYVLTRNLYLGGCVLTIGMLKEASVAELLAYSYATGRFRGC